MIDDGQSAGIGSLPLPRNSMPITPTPTSSELDIVRRESTHKRLQLEEWNTSTISEVMQKIQQLRNTNAQPQQEQGLNDILSYLDHVGNGGEIASEYIGVISEENLQLSSEIADIDACIAREEVQVEHLRKLLSRERKIVDQRKQLEGISKILLKYPQQSVFLNQLHQHRQELNSVQNQIQLLELEKVKLSKELALLLHCTQTIQTSATKLNELLTSNKIVQTSRTNSKQNIVSGSEDVDIEKEEGELDNDDQNDQNELNRNSMKNKSKHQNNNNPSSNNNDHMDIS